MKICSNKKTCIHKGKLQATSNFFKKFTMKDGYNPECKDCQKERRKEYWAKYKQIKKEQFSFFIGD